MRQLAATDGAFLIDPPPAGSASTTWYLRTLKRTAARTGTDALIAAEAAVVAAGGRALELQDQAFKEIDCDGRNATFDLGFRSLLATGRTWYEARGYAVVGGRASAARRRIALALEAFRRVPVARILDRVREEVAMLAETHDDTAAVVMADAAGLMQAAGNNYSPRHPTIRALRRERGLLLRQLEAAPAGIALGDWLLSLDACGYAAFMRRMYGAVQGRRSPALWTVHGRSTPSVREFKRANWLRRYAHRVVWRKELLRKFDGFISTPVGG